MNSLPDMKLERYDDQYIETFLNSYAGLVEDALEMANEWPEMDDQERQLQRSALIPSWEKRTLLGALYQAGRLTAVQVDRLRTLDQQLLERAAVVELAYGPTLGELLRYLFGTGTPLAHQSGTLRIETTITALAELAAGAADMSSPTEAQPV